MLKLLLTCLAIVINKCPEAEPNSSMDKTKGQVLPSSTTVFNMKLM